MTGLVIAVAILAIVGVAAFLLLRRRKTAVVPTPAEQDVARINLGICPECGAADALLTGPTGGAGMNIACDRCHSEFNVAFAFDGAVMVDRLGKLLATRAPFYGIDPAAVQS